MKTDSEFKEKLKNIKLFLVDVDGVMTDGGIFYFDDGSRARRYHMHDGRFSSLEKELGIMSGFCTGEDDQNIRHRAEKLKLTNYNIFGSKDKLTDVKELLSKNNWTLQNLAYVGDDLADLAVLREAGLGIAVNNAVPEVKKSVRYVTERNGGEGAVREIIDCFIENGI